MGVLHAPEVRVVQHPGGGYPGCNTGGEYGEETNCLAGRVCAAEVWVDH